jgi:hypothetical protein
MLHTQPDNAAWLMQRGYLRQRLDDRQGAVQDFHAARATGKAPPGAIVDEAYARAGLGDKRGAANLLKTMIDQADAGQITLTPEERYDKRSSIADLSRTWGASFSASYRGARPAKTGLGGAPIALPGNAVFSTAEVFWRPSNFLNTSTQIFEIYGRLANSLYNKGAATLTQTISDPCGTGNFSENAADSNTTSGIPSTVGSLGLRYTPTSKIGLTFGLERQFMLGSAVRSGALTPDSAALRCRLNTDTQTAYYASMPSSGGWLAYVTYGIYEGTALRIDTPSWFTLEGYWQAGYAWQDMPSRFWLRNNNTGQQSAESSGRMQRKQGFSAAELRVGRSYRVDWISERLVIFPYVVAAADWFWTQNKVSGLTINNTRDFALQGNGPSWSLGAGPGVSVRYWFREDHYHTPRSYLSWTMQYRLNLGGGAADRAKGWFMNFTLAY